MPLKMVDVIHGESIIEWHKSLAPGSETLIQLKPAVALSFSLQKRDCMLSSSKNI